MLRKEERVWVRGENERKFYAAKKVPGKKQATFAKTFCILVCLKISLQTVQNLVQTELSAQL